MNIAILILSAGSSTRMGKAKQLLQIGNTTLLGISIENALKSNANQVFCVLGATAELIKKSISKYEVETIINNSYKNGLSSSIVAGIHAIENKNFDAVLILLSDQPKVDATYLNTLIFSSEKQPAKIIASQYISSIGVPAIFPKRYFKQLKELKGDKGAKAFLNSQKEEVISIKNDLLIDIDTPEDYHNFLKSL